LEKTRKDGGDRLQWKNDKELQLKCFEGKDKPIALIVPRVKKTFVKHLQIAIIFIAKITEIQYKKLRSFATINFLWKKIVT
jgi:hypothetical protein